MVELPGNSLLAGALQNAGHTAAFCVLTFTLVTLLAAVINYSKLLWMLLALSALGVIIELVQLWSGRGFSWTDVLLDILGIFAGICFSNAVFSKSAKRLTVTWILSLTGLAFLSSSLLPAGAFILSAWLAPSLPVLVDFDTWGASMRVRIGGGTYSIAQHDIWADNDTRSIRVDFDSHSVPLICFLEPSPSWNNYNLVTFRVLNPTSTAATILIRIQDRTPAGLESQYLNFVRILHPGQSKIHLDLQESIERISPNDISSHHRWLKNVQAISLYAIDQNRPVTFLLDDLMLESKSSLPTSN